MFAASSLLTRFPKVFITHRFRRCAATHHNRDYLKERLVEIIPQVRSEIDGFKKANSSIIVDSVCVGQIFGGMRDIKSLYHEPSLLDPIQGIKFRGLSCHDVCEKLQISGSTQPLPESIFWFLLTGEIPNEEEVNWLSREWARRAELPAYLINLINSFPDNLHPMAQLSAAVTLLSRFSKFSIAYNSGNVPKSEFWKPMYEDCMNLIAKLPVISSLIYRNSFHDGYTKPIDFDKDWSGNYAAMLGVHSGLEFIDFLRLYLVLHSDHEGGNASSHTAHLVASTLSDVYLSYSAAMNALAGPLHGRANQEVVEWLNDLTDNIGFDASKDSLVNYVKTALTKEVIPGYGHAVLRNTDPRFSKLLTFAESHLPNNQHVKLVKQLFDIVPDILKGTGKVKNPWPNVDAVTGIIFSQFNLPELEYYTIPFAVSRSLGICSSLIWDRALSLPLERPKSLDLNSLKNLVKDKQ